VTSTASTVTRKRDIAECMDQNFRVIVAMIVRA
jgi:hypothetical protein